MMMRMYYLRIDSGITAGQPDEIRMDCVKFDRVKRGTREKVDEEYRFYDDAV